MPEKRKYELKKRAEQLEETRRRITEATVELHRTVGPAATQISEIARRAGVQRVTVYNHFPDETALFAGLFGPLARAASGARSGRLADDHGSRRAAAARPARALRLVPRDGADDRRISCATPSSSLPCAPSSRRGLAAISRTCAGSWPSRSRARGRRRRHVDAALGAAVDFHVWRAARRSGDADAADLGAGLVELAATGRL